MKLSNSTWMTSLVCLPALLMACSGEPDIPPSGSNEKPTDMMSMPDLALEDMPLDMKPEDAGVDAKADEDMPLDMPDLDVCEPLTECPMNVCGDVSDGCGGMLDCGACACNQGMPAEETCGPCGLGLPRCDEGVDTPELAGCEYPGGHEVLGEITDCRQVVFVDAAADVGGDGSPESPFVTYAQALETFSSGDRGAIIVDEGTYQEQLIIKDGVHVFSAYARLRDSWIQKPSSLAAFVSPRVMGEPAIGLRAEDITVPTIVHSVQAEPPRALPEETTYGAYLKRVEGLTISDSIILGQDGGDGTSGTSGQSGADGSDGKVATCQLVGVGVRSSDGGAGGVNPFCFEANGGKGGAGARYMGAQGNVRGGYGAGNADGTSLGGAPGELGTNASNRASGKDGSAPMGHATPVAADGMGGQAGGMIVDGFWVTTGHGGDGEAGATGAGGAGGGGAGGNSDRAQEQGGGGGGAGGCGGGAGSGGRAGGASFGLLALETQATLVNTVVYARDGGRGGHGGEGGEGGQAGQGAFVGSRDCTNTVRTWSAGNGADGIDGQDGGSGGGGAGGDSYGAFCEGSTLTLEASTIESGRVGLPGTGQQPGESGRIEDEVNCR